MTEPPASLPPIVVPWRRGGDPEALARREWLVTNGLGGYASGTLLGVPARRYHGVFVPNLPSPLGRTVMIPRLDEEAYVEGRRVRIGGAQLPDGRVATEVADALAEFRLEWQTPTWTFDLGAGRLERRVVMPYRQNTVYVEYRLVAGGPVRLAIRPYLAFRMHDGPLGAPREVPFTLTITRRGYEVRAFEGAPPLRFALRPQQGAFVTDQFRQAESLYRVERDRGHEHLETLPSPGYLAVDLPPGGSVAFVASVEAWDALEFDAATIAEAERRRLERLLARAPAAAREGMGGHLVLAADQFIVLPGSRLDEEVLARAAGDEARTVIAGYHWFTDWGRDTMISLEGLTLCTGRHREAGEILRTFARYVKDGLLPNLFPEGQRTALYHTADATLWYFHAIDRYLEATGDRETLHALWPVLASIVDHHVRGTHFNIGVDPADGLLREGADGYQLTWMDAKVEGWVVTPRRGKPVEINALWYNALCLMAGWAEAVGEPGGPYRELARRARAAFNARFWNDAAGCLYDVVDAEWGGDDGSVRPNQVFAISLRFPALEERRWRPVLDVVAAQLLTPVGLRTLAPGHRDYRPQYWGDLRARDAAYHQGTVWAWLIGHYLDAWRKVHGRHPARERAMLAGFEEHLADAGVGTISEIFDAEPPFAARGCIAQAWSVAEVLRAWVASGAAPAG